MPTLRFRLLLEVLQEGQEDAGLGPSSRRSGDQGAQPRAPDGHVGLLLQVVAVARGLPLAGRDHLLLLVVQRDMSPPRAELGGRTVRQPHPHRGGQIRAAAKVSRLVLGRPDRLPEHAAARLPAHVPQHAPQLAASVVSQALVAGHRLLRRDARRRHGSARGRRRGGHEPPHAGLDQQGAAEHRPNRRSVDLLLAVIPALDGLECCLHRPHDVLDADLHELGLRLGEPDERLRGGSECGRHGVDGQHPAHPGFLHRAPRGGQVRAHPLPPLPEDVEGGVRGHGGRERGGHLRVLRGVVSALLRRHGDHPQARGSTLGWRSARIHHVLGYLAPRRGSHPGHVHGPRTGRRGGAAGVRPP
mmetsp:Transcript_1728/g.4880  ORF Transcript_1728/g.4880 Transcript_1728/m.4880 type:complete len:358 (-) Transcript_1728:538-1611(-)